MKRLLAPVILGALLAAVPVLADDPAPVTPSSIVAAAPKSDWQAIDPADLLVMTLAPDAAGNPRQVVIQLIPPPFSQDWVGNIRTLAKAHWWDGTSVYRVVDNWVTQWGDGEDDPKKAKPLPAGIKAVPESEYATTVKALEDAYLHASAADAAAEADAIANSNVELGELSIDVTRTPTAPMGWHQRDSSAQWVEFNRGWPFAADPGSSRIWPIHCYGYVGVARDVQSTGTGAELYAVIGTPPRQLDQNIAVVGRVIEGIENLSSLPRGKGEAGVYDDPRLRVPILSVRLGNELPSPPRFEYLITDSGSFERYLQVSAKRHDPFYKAAAGGIDICNAKVPIRRVKP